MRIFANLSPFATDIAGHDWHTGAELLEHAYKKGFDGLEVNLRVLENPDTLWVISELDGNAVSFHSSYQEFNPGSSNRFIRNAAKEQLAYEYALAKEIKVKAVTFHPGRVKNISRDAAKENFWKTLDEFYSEQTPDTVRLCMENMDDTPDKLCNTVEEIRQTLDRFPALLLTCDVAHMAKQKIDADSFVAEFGEKIGHLHASGYKPDTKHSQVSLAESDIDFSRAFAMLKDRDIAVAIENKNWKLASETLACIRSAIAP